MDSAGLARAGAGRTAAEAASAATLEVAGKGRVVFSLGSPTSGVPLSWGATANQPGVNLVEELSEATARQIARQRL